MFKTAAVFSHNMVLQRNKNICIWGEAESGAVITASINGAAAHSAAKDGKWTVVLPPMPAGGPYELKLVCRHADGEIEEKMFTNVMLGEVWLCGGQSNMEFELQNCIGGAEELESLNADCGVRFYYTPKCRMTDKELYAAEAKSGWCEASPEYSRAWSAVGYFFAKKLAKDLGVTVGLIGCNWGGTSASNWMDIGTLKGCKETASYVDEYVEANKGKSIEQQIKEYDEYAAYSEVWEKKKGELYATRPDITWDEVLEICGECKYPGPNNCKSEYRPGGLYETMLMRVCPYTLKGFLYYQGESDDHKPNSYYKLFSNLIGLWREKWCDDELPFIFAQLPMFKYSADEDRRNWAVIRQAQARAYKTIKNTGMAVITDCGEFNEIHPREKRVVAERLCLQAEKVAYGMDVNANAPMLKSCVFKDGAIELSFDNAEGGFIVKGDTPETFEIAGEDGVFCPAAADIYKEKITVSSREVPEPKYVRFDWFNWTEVKLFGANGMPVMPFNTMMR